MSIDLKSIKLDDAKGYIGLWTIFSTAIIGIGFVGFFAYCTHFNIPYNTPSLYTVVGIGLYNLLFWVLLYIELNRRNSIAISAMITLFLLYFFSTSPDWWALSALSIVFLYGSFFKEFISRKAAFLSIKTSNKFGDLTDQTNESKHIDKLFYIEFAISIAFLLIAIFIDNNIGIMYFLILYAIHEMKFVIKSMVLQSLHVVMIGIIIPAILSVHIISNTSFSLFGTSINKIEYVKNSGGNKIGHLVLQDADNLYIKENLGDKETTVLPKRDLEKYNVLDGRVTYEFKSLIEIFQEFFDETDKK